MSHPNNHLLEWLRTAVVDLTEAGKLSRFELWHAIDGEGGEMLKVFRMEDREEEEDPDDFAQEIWDTAEHDATTRPVGTNQRYVLQAYREINALQPEAVHPFLINGRALAHLLGGDTEPPTEKGQQAQIMRHNENLHRMLTQLTDSSALRLAREVEYEHKRRIEAERFVLTLQEKERDLSDKKHERELELLKERAAQERSDKLNQMLMTMIPLVFAKLMSGKMPILGAPTAQSSRDESVCRFLESLRAEQMEGILGTLDPEQQMGILELYKSYRDDLENREKGRRNVSSAADTVSASATDTIQ